MGVALQPLIGTQDNCRSAEQYVGTLGYFCCQLREFGTFFGGIGSFSSLNYRIPEMSSLSPHAKGLALYRVQSASRNENAPNSNGNQRPVRYKRGNDSFAPVRLFRLAFGTVLLFGGAWPNSRGIFSSSRSGFWRLLGKVLTVILIGMGPICLFWGRLKDTSDHDSENEPRLHSGKV
jgi:hypothetical protein